MKTIKKYSVAGTIKYTIAATCMYLTSSNNPNWYTSQWQILVIHERLIWRWWVQKAKS